MSWWLSYDYEFDDLHHFKGGTYQLGGSYEASLNITYNYSTFYYRHIDENDGIRSLDGKTAKDVSDILEQVLPSLGDDVSDDYWDPTEGNAKKALQDLLAISKMVPPHEKLRVS